MSDSPDLLLGLLAAMLVWIAVVDVRTCTISNRLNLAIALLAPVFWWAAGCRSGPTWRCRSASRMAVFLLFAGAFYLDVMGGGDVKLVGALALVVPARRHAAS